MVFFRKSEEERPPKAAQELVDLRAAVHKARLPEAVAAVAVKELERLEKTDPSVAEYSIGLNYLDYLISLPWNRFTEDNLDLKRAERLLESQHYGLKHVKERILEYLAVRTLCSIQTSQVLVVDDEEIARTNLEYILRKEGLPGVHRGQRPGSPGKGEGPGVRRRPHRPEDGEDGRPPASGIREADGAAHRNHHGHRLRHGEHRGGRPEEGRGPLPLQAHQAGRAAGHGAGNRRQETAPADEPGAHPLLRRPPGHGQDLHRPGHRRGPGAQVRAPLPGRPPGRSRAPGPPAHLRGRHARPHHQRAEAPGSAQPRLHAGRDRQDRPGLPGRSGLGPPGDSGPGAKRPLRGPLPGRALRSLRRHVHHHRQRGGEAARPPAGPPGSHLLSPATPRPKRSTSPNITSFPGNCGSTACTNWASTSPTPASPKSSGITPGRRACGTWSGRSPWSAASSPASASRTRASPAPSRVDEVLVEKFLGPRKFSPRSGRGRQPGGGDHRAGVDRVRRRDHLRGSLSA